MASILSKYDTLRENNTKRIRILEKMAENLYKEWFVRFRFPGHENVKMVNGLPNGWKKGALSDVCEFKRGKNITSSEMKDGTIPVISAGITPSGFHSHANVYGISVTMSSSGANAGYIAVHYSGYLNRLRLLSAGVLLFVLRRDICRSCQPLSYVQFSVIPDVLQTIALRLFAQSSAAHLHIAHRLIFFAAILSIHP